MINLPPEIWLSILRWATICEEGYSSFSTSYAPFQTINHGASPALSVKRTLALVCRDWRLLTMKFLYEDFQILKGSSAQQGIDAYSKWVRTLLFFCYHVSSLPTGSTRGASVHKYGYPRRIVERH